MTRGLEVPVLDVNETLSDLEPLRARLIDSGAAVLRGLLSGVELSCGLEDAGSRVPGGFPELDVHPGVPAVARALAEG